MRPISAKTKKQLLEDNFMEKCCLAGKTEHGCSGRVEFHHNLIFAERQSDIPETILPVCSGHHRIADRKDIKELLDLIMLKRMSDEQIRNISKAIPYAHRLKYLKEKYD